MSEHAHKIIERHCDVAVIGGSAAGLAAALQLGRQRRSVVVIDSGEPRNAPASHMHSYLGHEGVPPGELAAIGREEARSYGVHVLAGRAVDVTGDTDNGFRVLLTGRHVIVARRVLAATGLVDELPDIEGLAEHWGRDVVHCPFCHGFEVRDRRIVQIVTHPMGFHPSVLWRQLTRDLTIVLHDGIAGDEPRVGDLRVAGVRVIDERVRRVVTGDDGHLSAVELADGTRLGADAVVIGPRFKVRAEALTSLGLKPSDHPTGLGDYIETDQTGATSVPGVYAAGNLTDPSQQVLQAAANGSWVGGMISFSLATEDVDTAAAGVDSDPRPPSAYEVDWDNRYGDEQIWSGNPNGSLVTEITGMEPGRALDVGAGEGADAIWLAEQGWAVTANDISTRALDRTLDEATGRHLDMAVLRSDANWLDAFASSVYDLVTAHYASIPRTPDGRGANNLLNAVAPGGTLLVVGHDLEPMRSEIDTNEQSRPFDPDAYLTIDEIAAAVASTPGWEIEVHEKRPRPAGHAHSSHHVDDIIFRARRL